MTRILRLGLFLTLAATGTAAQQAPTFRGGTDVVTVDVSVLDNARHPVTGLTAVDFSVTVDGKVRPIVAFKEVAPPPSAPANTIAAPWVRDVAPDVATNAVADGRLVVIFIDDYAFVEASLSPETIILARKAAHAIVDQLVPGDRAAVVFADNNHSAQTFTSDRRLLDKAIDDAALFPNTLDVCPLNGGLRCAPNPRDTGSCDCGVCPIKALEQIARALRGVPERRKIVMYISGGSYVPVLETKYETDLEGRREEHCTELKRNAFQDALRQLQISNVTVESIDPKGMDGREFGDIMHNKWFQRLDFLQTVAETTGGRAVIRNNDADQQVPAVLSESSSYYLLGVERPLADPRAEMHSIKVIVNRRDVEVRTRKGYFDESEKDRGAAAALAKGSTSPLLEGTIQSSGIPLELSAVPVLDPDGEAALAMALTVTLPPGQASDSGKDSIDLTSALFVPETGDASRSQKQHVDLSWSGADSRFRSYEVLSRLPAKPGRYELRVGAHTSDGRTGSVYTSIDIPDFAGDLALSGVVLHAKPAAPAAPPDQLAALLPLSPTARRVFRRTDAVTAFMRIYQKASPPAAATATTTLTNSKGEVVADNERTIDLTPFANRSSGDYEVDLPVGLLEPGEYLLTVKVSAADRIAERQLRFRVE